MPRSGHTSPLGPSESTIIFSSSVSADSEEIRIKGEMTDETPPPERAEIERWVRRYSDAWKAYDDIERGRTFVSLGEDKRALEGRDQPALCGGCNMA